MIDARAVFFAVAWSGGNLLYDYRNGYLDKLRVAPISRYSILAGEFVPLFIECVAMAGIILACSVLLGAPIATGLPGAVAVALLGGAFGVARSGTSFVPALVTRNEQATSMLSLLFFPIAFMSTAFVPAALMPEWLQWISNVLPASYALEALQQVGAYSEPTAIAVRDIAVVVGFAIVALCLAAATLRRRTP